MKQLILLLMLTQGAMAFGQGARVIEGKNRLQDEVLMDLILDSEKYNGQMLIGMIYCDKEGAYFYHRI